LVLHVLRRLQHLRDAAEARVVEDKGERIAADGPFADVLVAVDARAERFLRVIEMKRADLLDADVALHLVDHPLPALARADVVTGGEDVAGVDADANARLVIDRLNDPPQLLERAADARALPGRGLQQRGGAKVGRGVN